MALCGFALVVMFPMFKLLWRTGGVRCLHWLLEHATWPARVSMLSLVEGARSSVFGAACCAILANIINLCWDTVACLRRLCIVVV
jgi:hypothetical protein